MIWNIFLSGVIALVLLCPIGHSVFANTNDNAEIELLAPFPDEDPIRIVSADKKKKGAIYIMEQYVGKVFVFGAGLITILAVIWVIIGGYEIMFSGAAAGDISSGKDKIVKALLGLALVFLSALILHTINPSFFIW
jgi:hypothetical protein